MNPADFDMPENDQNKTFGILFLGIRMRINLLVTQEGLQENQ